MKKPILALAVMATMAASQLQAVQACGCYGGGPIEKSFKGADAVFSAEVTSVVEEKNAEGQRTGSATVTLKLLNQWKGAEGKTVTVLARMFRFKANKQYLVFAKRMPKSNILMVDYCNGTELLAYAKEEVAALNEMVPSDEPVSYEPIPEASSE